VVEEGNGLKRVKRWKACEMGLGERLKKKEIKKSKIELTGGRKVVISQSATENGRLKLRD
jgi:hypothetical protein